MEVPVHKRVGTFSDFSPPYYGNSMKCGKIQVNKKVCFPDLKDIERYISNLNKKGGRGMPKLHTFLGIMIVFFLFVYGSLAQTVSAESGKTYQVGTSQLNVRTSPSNMSEIIGKLGSGDRVVVFKEAYGWAQTYYAGQEAWVASHFLYGEDENQLETKITITANDVRIRTGPGTENHIIDSTNSGNSYHLIESKNNWHKISLADGTTGWVADWLTNKKHPKVGTEVETKKPKNESNTTSKQQTTNHEHKPLKGYNIVLDPGHGGKDPGAIGLNGDYEKDLILSTATAVAQKLRDAGATVISTRTKDTFLTLEDRVAISSTYYTHAFVSLHYDAHPLQMINGFSTHFYSSFANDRQLAQNIQSELAKKVPLKNRGIIQSNFHVLRENQDLAVLVELGFVSNPNDLSIIQTADYQNNVALGITNGLINYFH